MTRTELQETLLNVLESLIDARDAMQDGGDDGDLADIMRDMVDEMEGVSAVRLTTRGVMLQTTDNVRTEICLRPYR